ncbi:cell envelope integrity protein CreD [Hyphomicrobium sp. D-2]|uniref:cell envelope integrity protein CreD n=1 Tax=Hyphomicrobium sp. D-2 TaxID=3041621 RepID=UPI0024552E6A|nr:cell envelope integrity protein CreD [Hyphomicrobium sp. D-2]MDH4983696.1 cell envelope integrity protein CreD [Hyphomicrobium sp. D-2]
MDALLAAIGRLLASPGFKFFLICGLILLLGIPLLIVWGLTSEREQRAAEVRRTVAQEWGDAQYIDGPLLVVPYTMKRVTGEGDKRVEEIVERRAVFLPKSLAITGDTSTKTLHRSIYDVAVYSSVLNFTGAFSAPEIAEATSEALEVRWRDAILAVAVSDVSGLKDAASLTINNSDKLDFEPSIGIPRMMGGGIHVRLADVSGVFDGAAGANSNAAGIKPFSFKFALTLNGSSELKFAPLAQETTVAIKSDWKDPSFTGGFLPTERHISADGFTAEWQVPHLARSVPQAWSLSDHEFERMKPYAFGVRFMVPVDFYQVISRALKYATMFLGTAFMAVFLLELRSRRQVHPVQYLFVGLTMVFFYVLLLSLAEHIGFLKAYIAASLATGGLLSAYVARVQNSMSKGLVMGGVFLGIYGLLYLILQLEDYALLAGAIAGFVILATVMFATLKVDWSGAASKAISASPAQP